MAFNSRAPSTLLRQEQHHQFILFDLSSASTSSSSSSSPTINGSLSSSGSSFFVADLTRSESERDLLDDYFSLPHARSIFNVETLSDGLSNVKIGEDFPTDVGLEDQFEYDLGEDDEGWRREDGLGEGGGRDGESVWETISLS